MKAKKIATTAVYITIVVGVVVGLKLYNKGEAASGIRGEAQEIIQQASGYHKDTGYFDSLLDRHHPTAFDQAYTIGGRHTAASFDDSKYLQSVYSLMIQQAENDGRQEVADSLKLQKNLVLKGVNTVR